MSTVPFPTNGDRRKEEIARQIATAAAEMRDTANEAGLEVIARLLNLVRIEAELKADAIRRKAPLDGD